jgi:signal transduction histidine kinase
LAERLPVRDGFTCSLPGEFRLPRRRAFFALLIAILLLFATPSCFASPAPADGTELPPGTDILILSSYHPGYTWTDNELEGIRESFSRAGLKNELLVEHLDSKHFPRNAHFRQLRDLLAVKYGTVKPTLVMTLDNPAFEFAVTYRRDLFPGIPIVFAGLNDYDPAMLKGETGITGVVERQDIAGTVRAAMAIQPQVKEVVIVHDYTSSGLASRDEAHDQLAQLAGTIKFRYLPEMTIDEVVAELKKLQPGSIVLPFSFSRDKAGTVFNHALLAEILGKNSPVPVYGTKVERLGHGIIGGSLLEGKSHGATAAELALRILRGEHVDSIPVMTDPPSILIFDNNLLKRFGIDRARLPRGSRVINVPPGLYQQHGTIINIAGAIITVLALSLALVVAANRRRKIAESALLESERARTGELESANREMESFCYAVSHDLQTPLRHINAFSSIIEEEYADTLNEEARHYFSRIRTASVRMGHLIKDLLMLSQISREGINRVEFDLGVLAQEVLEENGLEGGEVHADIARGMIVSADRQLTRVVMDNLISNALKYSAREKSPTIRIGKKTEGRRSIYFVSDNGVGFDMQYAEKLFAPFQRLHQHSEFAGNGIGLATVQRVIHRHGGAVWAESSPGRGATFYFTLTP